MTLIHCVHELMELSLCPRSKEAYYLYPVKKDAKKIWHEMDSGQISYVTVSLNIYTNVYFQISF